MNWTNPEIDLTGTLHDLGLSPVPARLLGEAAASISTPALRAFLVEALLSHAPHQIRYAPDRSESGYELPGGRALRAAVMVRALGLLEGTVDTLTNERLIAAVLLGNLVHVGAVSDIPARRAWLERVADDAAEHLSSWNCSRVRARDLIDLAIAAATVYPHAPSDPWVPTTLTGPRMVLACRAAALARPLTPESGTHAVPLPAWMDPDLSGPHASWLFRNHAWMHCTGRQSRRAGFFFLAQPKVPVLSP